MQALTLDDILTPPPALPKPESYWDLDTALSLIRQIEYIAPSCGCHVGLTGGVLYKDGKRKDLDIILYRIRQSEKIDFTSLYIKLHDIGISVTNCFGFVTKATYLPTGGSIDIFDPEADDGEYEME